MRNIYFFLLLSCKVTDRTLPQFVIKMQKHWTLKACMCPYHVFVYFFFPCFVFQSSANCYLGSLILYSTAFRMLSSGPSFRGSRGASFASILSKSVTDEPRCVWTGITKRRGTILTHRILEYSPAKFYQTALARFTHFNNSVSFK